jgi:2-keto-3-deoxy-galactonokinase
MTPLAVIDDLAAASTRLRGAMEESDVPELETAMEEFRQSLERVQAIGAWRVDPILKQRIQSLLPHLEASRMLACLLGDLTGQKLASISAATGEVPQPLYRRKA